MRGDLDESVRGNAPEGPALMAAWVEWLRSMRWDWYVTLAFGYPVTAAHALRAVGRWLEPLPEAYGAVGLQHGPAGDRLHVHALVGGTGRHHLRASYLRGSWRRGSIVLDGYHPRLGGVEYLVRQASVIELVGSPRPYRPRR